MTVNLEDLERDALIAYIRELEAALRGSGDFIAPRTSFKLRALLENGTTLLSAEATSGAPATQGQGSCYSPEVLAMAGVRGLRDPRLLRLSYEGLLEWRR